LCRAIEWQDGSHEMIEGVDISNTSLIDSPLIYWLKRHYRDYVTEDFSERLWATYGTIAHFIMESFGRDSENEHVEATVIAEIGGLTVSTKLDAIFAPSELIDYKWVSAWAYMEGVKQEHINQLNTGRYIMFNSTRFKLKGKELTTGDHFKKIASTIERMKICAMFRDWGPRMAEEFPMGVRMYDIPKWPFDKVKEYVEERVRLHKAALKLDKDSPPPICTDEERWMSDFAIMKNGRTNALKAKIKTREEAEALLVKMGGDYIREATARRCEEYCPYGRQGLCPYWNPKTKEKICQVSPSKKSAPSSRKRYAGAGPSSTRTKRSK
jgi:hypothetical protein